MNRTKKKLLDKAAKVAEQKIKAGVPKEQAISEAAKMFQADQEEYDRRLAERAAGVPTLTASLGDLSRFSAKGRA